MYDVRQFKPALYVLLAMGFTGFCLATLSPGWWLFSMALLGWNAWLVKSSRFVPLPRLVANGITILAMAYAAMRVLSARDQGTTIYPIGEFLLLLQIVKLFEQRGNRDYAQLLVLSLLLMVAAAISTASLLFGILLIGYLLLSLYCCLLFHLKVETDHARDQMGLDEKRISPMTLRQDQRYLNSSMTRVTGFVSTFAIIMAVLVFLFFPRGPGIGLLGMQMRAQASTGFTDQAGDLQNVSRISQNTSVVAYVAVTKNGQPYTGPDMYLRGQVYDSYDVAGRNADLAVAATDAPAARRYVWDRTSFFSPFGARSVRQRPLPGNTETVLGPRPDPGEDVYLLDFRELRPTGTPVLFTLAGVVSIQPDRDLQCAWSPADQILTSTDILGSTVRYLVTATDSIWRYNDWERNRETGARTLVERRKLRAALGRSNIDPAIAEYARRPDVSGVDGAGAPLLAKLPPVEPSVGNAAPLTIEGSALNAEIARNIERHLQSTFGYTLDLTGTQSVNDTRDPIAAFLTDWKKGRCEHFASAMVLMCQSLGIPARRVDGFRVDEYNPVAGTWTVRQSHAHSWVEVLTDKGWQRFDPTSGRNVDGAVARGGVFDSIKNFFNYLEQTWSSSVIAYDSRSQANIFENVESSLNNMATRSSSGLNDARNNWFGLRDWIDGLNLYSISSKIIGAFLVLAVLFGVGAIATYLYQQAMLRRRARRIGLGELDRDEQIRLAKQLGFYDQLMRILERQQIARAPHQTPLEFSQSLTFLPTETYDAIVRLTQIFYRVRYGQSRLESASRRRLARVVGRIEESLAPDSTRG
jgi:transglutaminase-like putative cysteine protease